MGAFAGPKLPLINNASGGTVTEVIDGDLIYRVHSFTNVGVSTFIVPIAISGSNVEYLIVAGGGAGGASPYPYGAGGGAGGYRSSVQGESSGGNSSAESKINLSAGSYEITVGAGGAAATTNIRGNNGEDSSAFGMHLE